MMTQSTQACLHAKNVCIYVCIEIMVTPRIKSLLIHLKCLSLCFHGNYNDPVDRFLFSIKISLSNVITTRAIKKKDPF